MGAVGNARALYTNTCKVLRIAFQRYICCDSVVAAFLWDETGSVTPVTIRLFSSGIYNKQTSKWTENMDPKVASDACSECKTNTGRCPHHQESPAVWSAEWATESRSRQGFKRWGHSQEVIHYLSIRQWTLTEDPEDHSVQWGWICIWSWKDANQ